jgi:hypothetical protein
MVFLLWNLLLFNFYHCLEVDIAFDSHRVVVGFPLSFGLASLVHFLTTLFSVNLDLVNFVSCANCFPHSWSSTG